MSDAGEPLVYRIERHGAKVLHLYRGGELVDIEHDCTGDTRDDIERWGSGVAWAEDSCARSSASLSGTWHGNSRM